jgi:hypothetical protein
MKHTYVIPGAVLSAALLLTAGCDKSEPTTNDSAVKTNPPAAAPAQPTVSAPAAAPTPAPAPAVPTPASAVVPTAPAPPSTPTIRPAALVTTASNQVQTAAVALTNRIGNALSVSNPPTLSGTNNFQVQALLEKAKSLTDNQQYQEALATVTKIYEQKLTPEQKLKADELKNQIQNALSQKATGAALDMFGGKK